MRDHVTPLNPPAARRVGALRSLLRTISRPPVKVGEHPR
jgi:hypothetical protein